MSAPATHPPAERSHLARIGVILLAGFFFGPCIVIPLAPGHVEIYPMSSLRPISGDNTLEAGNKR